MNQFARNKNDTGSPEYQIALFTYRMKIITEHTQKNKKDFQATRGLLKIVNKRKRLLKYLYRVKKEKYKIIIKELNIKTKMQI
jgi:small subunit ribosomal protein S15